MNMEDDPRGPKSTTVRLTPQQGIALERGAVSVALSAGAGCGKTTVLTERFLQELEGPEGRPLKSVIAMTFTEKAARELRLRIRVRCREMLVSGMESQSYHWQMILRGLEAAPIGTFHEFCARMLRIHSVESCLDPEFTVLDESIARALTDQAVNTILCRAVSDQDLDIIDLAVDYGLGQIGQALRELIGSATFEELRLWGEMDPEAILSSWSEFWAREGRPALIREAAHSAQECRDTIESLDLNSIKIQDRRRAILKLIPALESGQSTLDELTELQRLARISDLRGKDIWPSEDCKKTVQKQFQSLRSSIDKILPRLSWSEKRTREEIDCRQRLVRLALKARSEYERLKHDRSGLDFDDLQIRFVKLLCERPDILDESPSSFDSRGSLFEFILVDEFQDTDRLQNEILRRLGSTTLLEGRLFIVGDYKQSIYGFRGADPSIFREWRQELPATGRRELNENFRSVPGIVHFVNALFADCFKTEEGSTGDTSSGTLNQLTPVREAVTSGPAVEFHWADIPSSGVIQDNEIQEPITGERASVKALRRAEAKSLARHIRLRIEEGWSIFDRKTKRHRLAGPGDVALLFRAMTDVGVYESAFAEEGLDYHTLGGSAFFAQQEIYDIINVLSVVEDPLDEIALAGALRSPFFSLTDDGLYWLATSFPEGLATGLARADQIAALPCNDRTRALRARTLLESWRGLKDRESIAGLVSRILTESGYEAALVCDFMGPRKLANTRKLVSMGQEFDRQGGFLLADFVSQLRAHRDDPPREEQASTSEEEGTSVRLMSIHRSKGLEFPIVVVPDLNRASDQRNRLIANHRELGLVMRPPAAEPENEDSESDEDNQGSSLGWEAYRAISREHEEEESLRIFYVAVTRARDNLILSSGLSKRHAARSTAMRLLEKRFDIASGALIVSLPEGRPIPNVRVISGEHLGDKDQDLAHISIRTTRRKLSLNQIRETCTQVLSIKPSNPIPSEFHRESIQYASLIDLDQLDGLSFRSRRIHHLIKATVTDPLFWQGVSLYKLVDRHGARHVPAANSAILQEVKTRLEPWVDSEAFGRFKEHSAESARPGFAWSLNRLWPNGRSSLFRGTCELLRLHPEHGWMPLVVALGDDLARSEAHRLSTGLRLVLSNRASGGGDLRLRHAGWILTFHNSAAPTLQLEERMEECDLDELINSTLVAFADSDA